MPLKDLQNLLRGIWKRNISVGIESWSVCTPYHQHIEFKWTVHNFQAVLDIDKEVVVVAQIPFYPDKVILTEELKIQEDLA